MKVIISGGRNEALQYCLDNNLEMNEVVIIENLRSIEGLRFTKNDVVRVGTWRDRPDLQDIEDYITDRLTMMSPHHPTVTVRVDDLTILLYGFYNREETALGSRPFKRLRDAVNYKE